MRSFNFKVKLIGEEKYLTYIMGEETELDEDVLDYCEENDLKELVKIIYEEDDDYDYLTYDITGRHTVDELLSKEMKCEDVLKVLRNVSNGLISLKEQAVKLNYILLNRQFMYIDDLLNVTFICLPVESSGGLAAEFKGFVRQFLANIRYDVDEDLNYVGKLLTYINGDNFNLRGMVGLSEALMEEEGISFEEVGGIEADGVEVMNSEDVEPEADSVKNFMDSLADGGDEPLPEIGDDEADETEEDVEAAADEELESILPAGMKFEDSDSEPEEASEEISKQVSEEVSEEVSKQVSEADSVETENAPADEKKAEANAESDDETDKKSDKESKDEDKNDTTETVEAAKPETEKKQENAETETVKTAETETPEAAAKPAVEATGEAKPAETGATADADTSAKQDKAEVKADEAVETASQEKKTLADKAEKPAEAKKSENADAAETPATEKSGSTDNLKKQAPVKPAVKETNPEVLKSRIKALAGKESIGLKKKEEVFHSEQEMDEFLGSKPPVIKKNSVKVNRAAIIQNIAASEEEAEAAAVKEKEEEQVPVIEEISENINQEKKPKSNSILSKTVEAATKQPQTVNVLNMAKAMPYLVRVNTNERIMLRKEVFKIGKSNIGVDYTIAGNGAISRQHAVIIRKDDVSYIKDNKSTNHTYVNDKKVEEGEEVILTHDSLIRLGDEEFVFKIR